MKKQSRRFIHIPKNAGTSLVYWLEKNHIKILRGIEPKKVGIHRYASFWAEEDSEKFCIIRNPYTRTISYYNYLTKGEKWNYTFEEFVRNKITNKKTKVPNAWNPQINWIYENDTLLVDKIIRYETMELELQDYFKCYDSFPKLNISTDNDYETYYTNELKQIVHDHFIDDFRLLGYKK